MFKWLKKLCNGPDCNEVGHNMIVEKRDGYYPAPPFSRAVVIAIEQERTVCSRCGLVEEDWHTVHETSIQSFTCPTTMSREIDRSSKENPYISKRR
jgi:hypothetical protein